MIKKLFSPLLIVLFPVAIYFIIFFFFPDFSEGYLGISYRLYSNSPSLVFSTNKSESKEQQKKIEKIEDRTNKKNNNKQSKNKINDHSQNDKNEKAKAFLEGGK